MIRLTGGWELGTKMVSNGSAYFHFNSFKIVSFMNDGKPYLCIRFYESADSLCGSMRLPAEDFKRLAKTLPSKQIDDQLNFLPQTQKNTPFIGPRTKGAYRHDNHPS